MQSLITTQNPAFHRSKILVRWGVLGMFMCVALVFVSSTLDLEFTLMLACAGYVGAFVCYMIGSYLFSKLCGSNVFVLNCVRFFTLLVFLIVLWLVLESFVDDMFGVIIIYLLCAGFCLVVGFGIGAGVDAQSFVQGIEESGLMWVYWVWWLVWFVLLCLSFLLYIMAYWKIEYVAASVESGSECKCGKCCSQ